MKHKLLNLFTPVRMFSGRFRQHHHRFCKWCELLAGILVGYETHLVLLTLVCIIWVVIDAAELFTGMVE